MLMEFRRELQVGDRVVTRIHVNGAQVPKESYGVLVGMREGIPSTYFVDFDHLLLRGIRRTPVLDYEIDKVFPKSFIPTTWDSCGWNPTGETSNG